MKRKILACVVACATLFLGMGYAYWTDSLQINTTADTGDLTVKFVDLALFGQYGAEEATLPLDPTKAGWAINDGIPNADADAANYFQRGTAYNIPWHIDNMKTYQDIAKNYTKTSFSAILVEPTSTVPDGADGSVYVPTTETSDGIKVTITDMYPGYAQIYRTDILNIGTIAAKLAAVKLDKTYDTDTMKNMIGVSLDVITEGHDLVSVLSDPTNSFTIGGKQFVRLSALTNPSVVKNTLFIYPGDNTFDAYFGIAMDPDYAGTYTTGHVGATAAVGNDANSQGQDASFSVQFLWDQFNTPAN